ncbi:Junction-mediating and -regulatory protein, partial [Stegodyphus mimosarum]
MDSPLGDLSDWVAVKEDFFVRTEETDHPRFICAWNNEETKIAITLHEGTRKASDQNHKNKVCLLSLKELYHIHKQFCLINSQLEASYPKDLKPNYVPSRKKFEYVSSAVEYYLSAAIKAVGKKIVIPTIFGEDDDDPLSCYEENLNEFRLRTLQNNVEKAYKELEEILQLRERAESLLQLTTVYTLEDQVATNISDALAELYNFQLQPFLELREVSRNRIKQAQSKLSEEIGPNIKQKAEKDYEEWNEQSLVATEALQQLYHEYYRRTLSLVQGQRDRMIEDKKKYGKVAFELHGMPRLLKLESLVWQEDLKLHNAIKATKEFQRDKIKSQLAYINDDSGAVYEIERIEEEITNAQIGVLDAHLEVLDVEERLYKSQLAILNKEYKDSVEIGVFFDAVENPEDLPDTENSSPEQNPKISKLKEKLNRIYRKRANIRN